MNRADTRSVLLLGCFLFAAMATAQRPPAPRPRPTPTPMPTPTPTPTPTTTTSTTSTTGFTQCTSSMALFETPTAVGSDCEAFSAGNSYAYPNDFAVLNSRNGTLAARLEGWFWPATAFPITTSMWTTRTIRVKFHGLWSCPLSRSTLLLSDWCTVLVRPLCLCKRLALPPPLGRTLHPTRLLHPYRLRHGRFSTLRAIGWRKWAGRVQWSPCQRLVSVPRPKSRSSRW